MRSDSRRDFVRLGVYARATRAAWWVVGEEPFSHDELHLYCVVETSRHSRLPALTTTPTASTTWGVAAESKGISRAAEGVEQPTSALSCLYLRVAARWRRPATHHCA